MVKRVVVHAERGRLTAVGVTDTLVVLPTYNEIGSLGGAVKAIRQALPHARVLIIDDASPDGTGRLADELAAADSEVSVLHREGKRGLGTAYIAGFRAARAAGAHLVVQMDADGSHLASDLPRLIAAADAGAGLVLGARWVPGGRIVNWPLHRRLISRTGTGIARVMLRSRLHDLTSGFRVISVDWLDRIDLDALDSQGYAFQVETAWTLEQLGCPIAEVPITFVERTAGRSKMTLGIIAEALRHVLTWGWRLRFGTATRQSH